MSVQKPREIAARVLSQRETAGDFTENLLETELANARLSPVDRALCQELVYGVVRAQAALDYLLDRKLEPGREQRPMLLILIRLGLYQMFWLDRIPNHAAIHESVELAKVFGYGTQSGFVNAVLRGYARERDATRKWLDDARRTEPHLGWSHPEWLVTRWLARFGAEQTQRLLALNNTPPPTFARVNTLRTDPERLVKLWTEQENVRCTPRSYEWTGDGLVFEFDAHPSIASMLTFQKGKFYVQDPSTLLAVTTLDPQPGESVLDLCAAPGGKTSFIAQRMQNRGRITAQDNDVERLKLVHENCTRLGTTCVETSLAPDRILVNPAKRFDRILVDAPCSNTGVLRRRVDLRWRIRAEEIERLAQEQLEILRRAAPRLKIGGTLVYSTCSLEPEENREVVLQFLAEHQDYEPEFDRELLPFTDGVDGAYVAKLRRTGITRDSIVEPHLRPA